MKGINLNPKFQKAVKEMDKENSPLVLEHQTDCRGIYFNNSISHYNKPGDPMGIDSFIGSVQSFRLYLNAMRTLLNAGVIAP